MENMFTQAVKLLISFREPPGLNLGLQTEYCGRDFSRFFSFSTCIWNSASN